MKQAQDGLVVYVVASADAVRFLHDGGDALHVKKEFDTHHGHGHSGTPGRMHAGATPADRKREAFARVIADEMNHMSHNVAGFILAAPAAVLHAIREHLTKITAAKVITTLSKDLGSIPTHALRDHFDIPATGWVLPK